MLVVSQPTDQTDLNAVRDMMRAFIAWHRERHVQDPALIDAYFDAAAFEDELAGMRLDTSIRQAEATGLYKRLGFELIDPYYELPDPLRQWLIFMELRL